MENEHTKYYTSPVLFEEAWNVMNEFQLLHNFLRHDYSALIQLTEKHINLKEEFNTLYNSCLIRLFTLIEADMYGLYLLDPYPESKATNFFDKFKNTFNQIGATWEKESIVSHYYDTHWDELSQLKVLRNSFTHPKIRTDVLPANIADFNRLKAAWDNYNKFMVNLMTNFFVGYSGNFGDIDIDAIRKRTEEKGLSLSKIIFRTSSYDITDDEID